MAEKQIVQRSEELLRPQTQSREDRDKDRVEQIQQTARDEVSQFDDWLDAADIGGTELFGIGSRFERRIIDRLPLVTALRTRHRIMDVIGAGVQEHQTQLAASGGEFSRVEAQVFANSRVNTMHSIAHRGRGAHESLLVAETSEELMNHSLRAFDQQWDNAKASAEAYFSTRKWWEKGTTFWRKSRFESFSRKFEAKLEQQKTRIQTGIDIVKNKKKADVERAENFLDRAFKNADDSQRERQWEAIKDVVETPASAAASMAVFGFPARLSQSDFLEALRSNRFDYVQGTVACRRSEHLKVDSDAKIKQLQERDTELDNEPDFEGLRARLKANAVKPATGSVLDTEKMAVAVEKEILRIPGIDLVNDVYLDSANNVQSIEGITAAEKMYYFSKFIGDDKLEGIHIDVRRQLLQYLENLDEETENDYENADLLVSLEQKAKDTHEAFDNITNATGGLNTIGAQLVPGGTNFNQADFETVINNWKSVNSDFARNLKYFEKKKEKIPTEDKEKLEKIWDQLKESQEKIVEITQKWEEEAKKRSEYAQAVPQSATPAIPEVKFNRTILCPAVPAGIVAGDAKLWLTFYDQKINYYEAVSDGASRTKVGVRGTPGPGAEALAQRVSGADQKIQQVQAQRDSLQEIYNKLNAHSFTNPNAFATDIARVGIITPPVVSVAIGRPAPLYNARAQNRLRKEFNEEAEKNYLAFLQKNTEEQWQILQHVPKGARVSLAFRDVTNVSQLNMPADLQNNREEVSQLRVISKTEKHVLLEDAENVYEIQGASADGDKFRDNIAVYKKLDAAGNPDPNVPANDMPFHAAKSTPNRTGTILSMSIS